MDEWSTGFQPFFLNKCYLDFCKPSISFQSLEIVDSGIFCQFFFTDFMEKKIFEGSYSTIIADNLAFTSLNIFSAP